MSTAGATFGALSRLLGEMAFAIAQMTRAEFIGSAVDGVSGSIGGHVRHCLDHVRAFERGLETGMVDYDTRRRQTPVEHDRELAVLSLTAAASRLERHTDLALGHTVVVRSIFSRGGPIVECRSSVSRELAFVISHTIHHGAQIALLADRLGATRLPRHFGVAPSTPLEGVA